jgi:hypothetical protein
MEMILLDASGLRTDAVLLAAGTDRLRVVLKNGKDTIELRREGEQWISEDGGAFEFDAWIAGTWPGQETPGLGLHSFPTGYTAGQYLLNIQSRSCAKCNREFTMEPSLVASDSFPLIRRTGLHHGLQVKRVNMDRPKPTAYRAFRALDQRDVSRVRGHRMVEERGRADRQRIPDSTKHALLSPQRIPDSANHALLPPLEPYRRCTCGACRKCSDNARWDRIFAKFETTGPPEVRGLFRCTLNGF